MAALMYSCWLRGPFTEEAAWLCMEMAWQVSIMYEYNLCSAVNAVTGSSTLHCLEACFRDRVNDHMALYQ